MLKGRLTDAATKNKKLLALVHQQHSQIQVFVLQLGPLCIMPTSVDWPPGNLQDPAVWDLLYFVPASAEAAGVPCVCGDSSDRACVTAYAPLNCVSTGVKEVTARHCRAGARAEAIQPSRRAEDREGRARSRPPWRCE